MSIDKSSLRGPGVLDFIMEAFAGHKRPLDCIQMEITSFCAARCIYCPHTTMAESWISRHMADEIFAASWPLLLRASRVHLQGWGEPLLHPGFFDFCELGLKAGCRVSTTTCGLRMDETIAQKIVSCGLDIIAFSLAGTDEQSNSARAGIPFGRVIEAIKVLQTIRKKKLAAHLEVHLAYIMLADRMEDVLKLPDLMKDLGLHGATISTLDYIADESQRSLAIAPHEQDKISRAEALLSEAAAKAHEYGLGFEYILPKAQKSGLCRENVGRSVYIASDGGLSPCVYLNLPAAADIPRRRVFGNVLEGDAFTIWHNDAFKNFRAALASEDPDGACVDCPKRFEI